MITFSSKETVHHEVDGTTFTLTVPTMLSRSAYRRDIRELNLNYHSDAAMLACLREGVSACVDPDDQGQMVETINNFEYESKRIASDDIDESEKEKAGEDLKKVASELKEVEAIIVDEYPPYKTMENDRLDWRDLAPKVAFLHFVTGWSDKSIKFAKVDGLVDSGLLDSFGEYVIDNVGWKIILMMAPTKAEEKNS